MTGGPLQQMEQPHREVAGRLAAPKLQNEVLLPLMGGSDSGDWHLNPEKPAILIGTHSQSG